MENQFLLEGEEILTESTDKIVTLTNKRIKKSVSSFGNAHVISMHLEKISTIEIHYRSWPWILIFGILLVVTGLILRMQNNAEILFAGILAGLGFILIYFITYRHLITITSDGGTRIDILTKGMKREGVLEFVNKIENAKGLIKQKE